VLIDFLEDVYKILNDKEARVCLFLDLSKVFDLVNHSILLQKLDAYGIRGTAYQRFGSYLKYRKQLVEVDYFSTKTNEIQNKQKT
jgi:hypothetical protein